MLIHSLPAHKKPSRGPLKLYHSFSSPLSEELPSRLEDVVQTAMALARPLLAHLHCVVVTLGAHGILLCGKSLGGSVSLHPGAREQVRAWKANSELSVAVFWAHTAPLLFLVAWQQRQEPGITAGRCSCLGGGIHSSER